MISETQKQAAASAIVEWVDSNLTYAELEKYLCVVFKSAGHLVEDDKKKIKDLLWDYRKVRVGLENTVLSLVPLFEPIIDFNALKGGSVGETTLYTKEEIEVFNKTFIQRESDFKTILYAVIDESLVYEYHLSLTTDHEYYAKITDSSQTLILFEFEYTATLPASPQDLVLAILTSFSYRLTDSPPVAKNLKYDHTIGKITLI